MIMNSNPYYQKKPKIVSAVSESIGDLKAVLSQRAAKRKQDPKADSTSDEPSCGKIKLKKDKTINETNRSHTHTHNIKGLSEVLGNSKKNHKKTTAPSSSSSSSSSGKRSKNQDNNVDDNIPKMTEAEEKALARSREILEKKAKIYEAMSKGALVYDPEGETIMVDFQRKAQNNDGNDYYANEPVNSVDCSVGERSRDTVSVEKQCDNGATTNDSEQLLEYVDKFGRTRLLKQSQIDQLLADDPEERNKQTFHRAKAGRSDDEHSDDGDGHRERIKVTDQLNEDAEFIADQEEFQRRLKTEIHYQDIQDGEIREHGVAYYKFSTDAKERAEEMKTFSDVHRETLIMQRKVKQQRRQRRQLARERLVKICQEKGLPIPPEDPPSEDEPDPEEEEQKAKVDEPVRIQRATLPPNKTNKNGHREWDEGKDSDAYWIEAGLPVPPKRTPFYTPQQFIQKQRDERNPEFAPPQVYASSSRQMKDRRQ